MNGYHIYVMLKKGYGKKHNAMLCNNQVINSEKQSKNVFP